MPKFRSAKVSGILFKANKINQKLFRTLTPLFAGQNYLCYLNYGRKLMKIKSFLAKPFAGYIYKQIRKGMATAVEDQEKILKELIKTGKATEFGKEHGLARVSGYEEFRQAVPIRDYEKFKPYIDQIKEGKHNILWKGRPIYFAKTSGTTSGVKYIPITKDSIANHLPSARNALFCYMAESGNTQFTDGKMIFLSGSPELERIGGIPTGRLSGIVNHHVPAYLRTNQLPSYETNCIEEWETKLNKIVEETINQDMTPDQWHSALDADVF